MDESDSSPSPLDVSPRARVKSGDAHRRSHRSSKLAGSTRELARLLLSQERDTTDLRQTLANVSSQLRGETERADAAESRAKQVAMRVKALNEAKVAAEQEAQRAREELGLYKLQLETAQKEINRAQELIDTLETQRLDAEAAAARARSTARKLNEQRLVQLAREEGYRQGLEEGIAQGRNVGYEEGRAEGYERARVAQPAQPSYTEELQEPSPASPEQGNIEGPYSRPRRSTYSSSSSGSRRAPDYTQPLDQSLPNPPPVTTPARIPTPAQSPVANDQEIHPIIIHNAPPSPSHPHVDYPPDNWIPAVDVDGRIRLPPAHELGPPPPSPSPPPGAVLQSATNIRPGSVPSIMVPPPGSRRAPSVVSDTESITAPSQPRPRHVRRRSNESQSTTFSQFDILGPPIPQSDPRDRASKLSAIAEERERSSSMSPPDYATPQPHSGLQISLEGPPSHVPAINVEWSGDGPGSNSNFYMRPRWSLHDQHREQHRDRVDGVLPEIRSDSPSCHLYDTFPSLIRVEVITDLFISSLPRHHAQKSRSESGPSSRAASSSPRGRVELLSEADAANAPPPLPMDPTIAISPGPEAFAQPVIPSSAKIQVLPDGQLPPGFVPMTIPPGGMMSPAGSYNNPMTPAGVPLPPSTYGGTPSVVNMGMPGDFPGPQEPVVVQAAQASGYPSAGPQPVYSRSRRGSLSGSEGDNDSLTTPPARRRNLPAQGTPSYAEAPLPPGVVYPAPPRPASSTSSRGTRAAGVPLPPSTVGSVGAAGVPLPPSTAGSIASPGSSVVYQSMYAAQSQGSLPLSGRKTPGGPGRPLSPIVGSPHQMPSPLGMPEPPSMPQMDRFYATQGGSVPAVSRPPSAPMSARGGSDTSSQVSFSGASATSRSKKKGKKGRSRIAAVEEVPDEE
ncbi:hypothetical protein CERSUDRAFT_91101 [Gelatoporia subvermispora B]|uniref:Uncharacterized protein n=1 Tax=Ceriporiopsis subvermispora (strain B) TaxID=914234 RepID=M2R7H3_CERS8|nr:hypothetical protein CERSUDRAFT_91101 [Gelatoporia subvermispora B]